MMPPFMNTVGAVKHATVVRVVHDVVVHTFCETDADAVSSEYPKLSPLIVTVYPPVRTELVGAAELATGAALQVQLQPVCDGC